MTASIIIPAHNGLALTRRCVESIRRHTPPLEYEIIVVDNGSADGTGEWLAAQPDIRTVSLPVNAGFPAACNRGLAEARGEALLLLNNDTVATPRWLEQLLACLNSDGSIGAVGPVTNAASYYTARPAAYRSLDEMTAFAERFNRSDPARWEERLKLVGFCLLFKREAYERVGGLDERFSPGNFEDDDFCLRMRQAGFRCVLCADTFVHHEGSASFRQDVESFARLLQANAAKFERKWGFDPNAALAIQEHLIDWIDDSRPSDGAPFRVLEVGCGCGATLLAVKHRFPGAQTVGIESNAAAAAIAATAADAVHAGEFETADPALLREGFDCILLGERLPYASRPGETIRRAASCLKPGGAVLAAVPNLAHFAVLRELMRGHWRFRADASPIRFYTLDALHRLFGEAGLSALAFRRLSLAPVLPRDELWLDGMARLAGETMREQWTSTHFLVKARAAALPSPPAWGGS